MAPSQVAQPQLRHRLEDNQEAALVQIFRFKTRNIEQEVSVTHANAVWVLYLRGKRKEEKRHNVWNVFTSKTVSMSCSVDVEGGITVSERGSVSGETVDGKLTMDWVSGGPAWSYTLIVNDIAVPAFWSKAAGQVEKVNEPEVVGPPVQPDPPPTDPWTPDEALDMSTGRPRSTGDDREKKSLPFLPRFKSSLEKLPFRPVWKEPEPDPWVLLHVDQSTEEHSTVIAFCQTVEVQETPAIINIAVPNPPSAQAGELGSPGTTKRMQGAFSYETPRRWTSLLSPSGAIPGATLAEAVNPNSSSSTLADAIPPQAPTLGQ